MTIIFIQRGLIHRSRRHSTSSIHARTRTHSHISPNTSLTQKSVMLTRPHPPSPPPWPKPLRPRPGSQGCHVELYKNITEFKTTGRKDDVYLASPCEWKWLIRLPKSMRAYIVSYKLKVFWLHHWLTSDPWSHELPFYTRAADTWRWRVVAAGKDIDDVCEELRICVRCMTYRAINPSIKCEIPLFHSWLFFSFFFHVCTLLL